MQQIRLKLEGDSAWPELDPAKGQIKLVDLPNDVIDVAFLDDGTEGGQPVVLFRSDLDGTAYVLQVTGRQFQALAQAFHGKYGAVL